MKQILLLLVIAMAGCCSPCEIKPSASDKRYVIKIWEDDKVVRTYKNVYHYKTFKNNKFKSVDFIGDGFQGEERQVDYTIEEQTNEPKIRFLRL